MKAFHVNYFHFCHWIIGNAATNEIDLTVIAGAETHAMIEPCDCPQDRAEVWQSALLLSRVSVKETICFCWMQVDFPEENL